MKGFSSVIFVVVCAVSVFGAGQAAGQAVFPVLPGNAQYPVISSNNDIFYAHVNANGSQILGGNIVQESFQPFSTPLYDTGSPDVNIAGLSVNGSMLSWLNMPSTHGIAMVEDYNGVIGGGQALVLDPNCPTSYLQGKPSTSGSTATWDEVVSAGNVNIMTAGLSASGVGTPTLVANVPSVIRVVTNGPYLAWQSGFQVNFASVSNPGTVVPFGANDPFCSSNQQSNPSAVMVGNVPIILCQVNTNGTLVNPTWQIYGENPVTGVTLPISSNSSTWESSPACNSNGVVVWSNFTDGNLYYNHLPSALLAMPSGDSEPSISNLVSNTQLYADADTPDALLASVPGKTLTNPNLSDDYAVFNLAPASQRSISSPDASFGVSPSDMVFSPTDSYPTGVYGVALPAMPIPEPCTMAMLAGGGLVVLLRVCCRRRKR